MKHISRILCAVLAVALFATMLTGCTMPKPTFKGTGDVAATYGDGEEISTGLYLAYLYNNFYQIYQSYYYYEQYGIDPWTQTIPYDTVGEDGKTVTEKLELADYITQYTKDTIVRQIVIDKMLKDNNLKWVEEDEKDIDKELAELPADSYLPLGFNNDNFISAYKSLMLNEWSLFMGLYGKGGIEEVKDTELRKYFDDNYLSYKAITVSLTDKDGKELSEKDKKAQMDKLEGYLKTYNEKGFEKAVDAYNKDNAGKDEKVEASKDEDNRNDVDATEIDENLAKAIRKLKVGECKIIEYKAGGSTPTAALVLRMDINEPKDLYTDSYDAILQSIKYESFNEMIEKAMKETTVNFDEKVIKKCDPKTFAE